MAWARHLSLPALLFPTPRKACVVDGRIASEHDTSAVRTDTHELFSRAEPRGVEVDPHEHLDTGESPSV